MIYTVQKWGARSDGSTFHWFSKQLNLPNYLKYIKEMEGEAK
jgi:hypothetical protein